MHDDDDDDDDDDKGHIWADIYNRSCRLHMLFCSILSWLPKIYIIFAELTHEIVFRYFWKHKRAKTCHHDGQDVLLSYLRFSDHNQELQLIANSENDSQDIEWSLVNSCDSDLSEEMDIFIQFVPITC